MRYRVLALGGSVVFISGADGATLGKDEKYRLAGERGSSGSTNAGLHGVIVMRWMFFLWLVCSFCPGASAEPSRGDLAKTLRVQTSEIKWVQHFSVTGHKGVKALTAVVFERFGKQNLGLLATVPCKDNPAKWCWNRITSIPEERLSIPRFYRVDLAKTEEIDLKNGASGEIDLKGVGRPALLFLLKGSRKNLGRGETKGGSKRSRRSSRPPRVHRVSRTWIVAYDLSSPGPSWLLNARMDVGEETLGVGIRHEDNKVFLDHSMKYVPPYPSRCPITKPYTRSYVLEKNSFRALPWDPAQRGTCR